MTDPVPLLSLDERHLLNSLKIYGTVTADRDFKAAIGLVKKGLAVDTKPEAGRMWLVLTEAGEREVDGIET